MCYRKRSWVGVDDHVWRRGILAGISDHVQVVAADDILILRVDVAAVGCRSNLALLLAIEAHKLDRIAELELTQDPSTLEDRGRATAIVIRTRCMVLRILAGRIKVTGQVDHALRFDQAWQRAPSSVPALLGLCVLSVMLALYGQGIALTIIIVLLGLFIRSDYSLLSAMVLDVVGKGVATTTLGVVSFTRFVIGAISPLIAGVLYERMGMDAVLYYAAGIYALAAVLLLTTRLQSAQVIAHKATH